MTRWRTRHRRKTPKLKSYRFTALDFSMDFNPYWYRGTALDTDVEVVRRGQCADMVMYDETAEITPQQWAKVLALSMGVDPETVDLGNGIFEHSIKL